MEGNSQNNFQYYQSYNGQEPYMNQQKSFETDNSQGLEGRRPEITQEQWEKIYGKAGINSHIYGHGNTPSEPVHSARTSLIFTPNLPPPVAETAIVFNNRNSQLIDTDSGSRMNEYGFLESGEKALPAPPTEASIDSLARSTYAPNKPSRLANEHSYEDYYPNQEMEPQVMGYHPNQDGSQMMGYHPNQEMGYNNQMYYEQQPNNSYYPQQPAQQPYYSSPPQPTESELFQRASQPMRPDPVAVVPSYGKNLNAPKRRNFCCCFSRRAYCISFFCFLFLALLALLWLVLPFRIPTFDASDPFIPGAESGQQSSVSNGFRIISEQPLALTFRVAENITVGSPSYFSWGIRKVTANMQLKDSKGVIIPGFYGVGISTDLRFPARQEMNFTMPIDLVYNSTSPQFDPTNDPAVIALRACSNPGAKIRFLLKITLDISSISWIGIYPVIPLDLTRGCPTGIGPLLNSLPL